MICIVPNQTIKTKWTHINKEWYVAHGYIFTNFNEYFNVNISDLSPRSGMKITAVCDYCGQSYQTAYATLYMGRSKYPKDACACCAPHKANDINHNKRARKAFSATNNICARHGYRLLTSQNEFTNVRMDIKYICPKHGQQSTTLSSFINGHTCYYCGRESVGKKLRRSKQSLLDSISKIGASELLNPEDYSMAHERNLVFRCDCGKEFKTSFENYVYHTVTRCPSCSQKESKGERIVREFLERYDIDFVPEKRFPSCRDIKPLPFDFYLPVLNTIIEFDGQHHYFPVHGEYNHTQTVKHDKIKNNFCITNNIAIIRIPYWDGENIKTILSEKLGLTK